MVIMSLEIKNFWMEAVFLLQKALLLQKGRKTSRKWENNMIFQISGH